MIGAVVKIGMVTLGDDAVIGLSPGVELRDAEG